MQDLQLTKQPALELLDLPVEQGSVYCGGGGGGI